MRDSIVLIGLILLVMASAQLYSWALTSGGVPQAIAGALVEVSQSPIVILLLINALLLFVGMFIEANAAIIILIPILFPGGCSIDCVRVRSLTEVWPAGCTF